MVYSTSKLCAVLAGVGIATMAFAHRDSASAAQCPVSHAQLKAALQVADGKDTSGFNNHFWGVVVNVQGIVCAVAYSGPNVGSQWLDSRQIAAAKAFTANGLSLDIGTGTGALSTAQLYQFVQPSNPNVANPLYGLAGGNVMDAAIIYRGAYTDFGTANDPLVNNRVGGTITFGGGLALYNGTTKVGGLGLSGDTACADHSTAWRTRRQLGLEQANPQDKLTFSTNNQMNNGHPHCPNDASTQGSKGSMVSAN